MSTVTRRDQIPEQFKWDTASIYGSMAQWEASLNNVRRRMPELAAFQGHLADSAESLLAWFKTSESVLQELSFVMLYADCAQNVNTIDQVAAAMLSRAGGLAAEVEASIGFAEPEILAIDDETHAAWRRQVPELAVYAHDLEALRLRAAHVRSAEVEELLGQVSDAFASATRTHSILADADMDFGSADSTADGPHSRPITQGTIDALVTDADRLTRRTAWERYADAHIAVKNSMGNALATGVKQDVFEARARRYRSALEASTMADFIPPEVYGNVLATFQANVPTWHRYWRVRKRALGYDTLYPYDLKSPLSDQNPHVPFEQAVKWICQGLAPMGEDYVETVRRGATEERWVDVYPHENKTSGAFSTGVYGTRPLILMSYTDDLFSLSTLAHELGHSMHSYSTWAAQPQVYGDYALFIAEVASNFHQALVRDHLLRLNDDPGFRIAVLEEALANFYRYFFLMPTLARFELAMHEREEDGQGLSADIMSDALADFFGEAFGDVVEMDRARMGITWAQFHTHLYYSFYVYQYTTGIAAAHALAGPVLAGDQGAVERYRRFLNAGSSMYPLDALRMAGVDMLSPDPVQIAFDNLASMIDELAALLGVSAA